MIMDGEVVFGDDGVLVIEGIYEIICKKENLAYSEWVRLMSNAPKRWSHTDCNTCPFLDMCHNCNAFSALDVSYAHSE